jgi:hypothetical protein
LRSALSNLDLPDAPVRTQIHRRIVSVRPKCFLIVKHSTSVKNLQLIVAEKVVVVTIVPVVAKGNELQQAPPGPLAATMGVMGGLDAVAPPAVDAAVSLSNPFVSPTRGLDTQLCRAQLPNTPLALRSSMRVPSTSATSSSVVTLQSSTRSTVLLVIAQPVLTGVMVVVWESAAL